MKTLDRLLKNRGVKIVSGLFFVLCIILVALPFLFLTVEGLPIVPRAVVMEESVFAIKLSLKTTLISTVFVMIAAIPTCIIISSSESRIKRFFELVLYIPMSLPHLVAGIALLLFFGRTPIGKFMMDVLRTDFIFTVQGIIIAQAFVNLPFAIKNLSDFIRKIDDEYYMAARSYGANEWQV